MPQILGRPAFFLFACALHTQAGEMRAYCATLGASAPQGVDKTPSTLLALRAPTQMGYFNALWEQTKTALTQRQLHLGIVFHRQIYSRGHFTIWTHISDFMDNKPINDNTIYI